jgi:hypothetical protein
MKLGVGFAEQLPGPVRQEFDLMNAILNTWRKSEHKPDGAHADLTSDTLVNAGLTNFGGPWELPQSAVISPPQITANKNDYRPLGIDAAIVLRLSTDASRTLTGLYNADIDTDRWLLIVNVGSFNLVLAHNVTSTAAYRFACPGGVDLTLASADCALVWYDHSAGNWRIVARATSAASSGISDGDKGDITVTASGATWTIDAAAVTLAKMADLAQSTIIGRAAGAGTGVPTALTATQATAVLNNVVGDAGAGGTKGLAPAPGAGDAAAGKFLKADGTYAVPTGTGSAPWSLVTSFALSGAASYNVTGLASYTDIRVLVLDVTFGSSSQTQIQVSTDNGSTFLTASGDYRNIAGNGALANDTRLLPYSGSHTAARGGECAISGWNLTAPKVSRAVFFSVDSVYLRIIPVASALNALQISASVDFTGGTAYVYGRAA